VGFAAVDRLAARPRLAAVLGAVAIAFSAPLVELADAEPATAALFRCLYAVPVLWLIARVEDRRLGPRPRRARVLAGVAGLLFAVDLVAWHHAIDDVGSGLATVLGNLQVAFVPLVAWAVLREHPTARVLRTLPLVMAGIVLLSGVLEDGAYGDDPVRGVLFGLLTGVSYAGFLLVLRAGSNDLRRVAGPLSDATLVAALGALAIGAVVGEIDAVPSWPSHGWLALLALTSQVLGWLLITSSLPRLPAAISSLLLTVQPLGSLVLGVLLFTERPSALQLAGVALVLTGLVAVARSRPAPPSPATTARYGRDR
jgi:drug/metabolite transporter (DMT)-like permease